MADKAASAGSAPRIEATKTAVTRHRMKLQSDYGQAVRWAKGFAAQETKAAFDRAPELASTIEDFSERFAALNGQWTLALVRGELGTAGELASAFLHEAENAGCLMEAGVAHRGLAFMSYFAGDFAAARLHREQALATCSSERDLEARERSGEDTRAVATAMLALASWQLGEVVRARELIEAANRRAAEIAHVASTALPLQLKSLLEIMRGDATAALTASKALEALSREHGMALQQIWAEMTSGWAHGRLHDPKGGAAKIERALGALREIGSGVDTAFYLGLLAQLEAEAFGIETGSARLDEAFALSKQVESRSYLSYLHRLRGDFLLKGDPGKTASAEDAFRAAIIVAKEQGARPYHLQAALPLAKLYQSTGRPLEAHAVLSDALEGFAPTPEMPEIAEAQALLAALAGTDEVKAAEAQRERRLHLQTAYGQAVMHSRGFGSNETKTVFAHARTLVARAGDASERFDAYYGLFVSSVLRGELSLARETAESFLREAEHEGRMTEAAVARRNVGVARLHQGDFIDAEANFAEALRTYDPERDRDAKFRFGVDTGAGASGFLALASWPMGDVERARALSEEALARPDDTGHAPTRAFVYHQISLYQTFRGDAEAVKRIGTIVVELSREHGMGQWLALGGMQSSWARARLGDRETEITELRRALAAYFDTGNKLFVPLFQGQLAELEAEGQDADEALRRIDEALALANETGEHFTDSMLQRIRGAILLKRDPADAAPAEEAFLAAIAVAHAQKARSFELQAALALAKLYRSTGRPAEAHTVLSDALEGFSRSPEMPEIAEAEALMERLA